MLYPVLTPHSRMPLKHRIWMTFESPSFSRAAFWYAQFSLLIITTSTITFCLESELNCKAFSVQGHNFVTDSNCETWENAWVVCEVVAVVCFTVELLLRFITSPSRWLFLQNLMNWVDFVAVLPFFLEQIIGAVEAGQESGSGESDSPLGALSVFRVIRLVSDAVLLSQCRRPPLPRAVAPSHEGSGLGGRVPNRTRFDARRRYVSSVFSRWARARLVLALSPPRC